MPAFARPGHWPGTDEPGRNILSRSLYGLRFTHSRRVRADVSPCQVRRRDRLANFDRAEKAGDLTVRDRATAPARRAGDLAADLPARDGVSFRLIGLHLAVAERVGHPVAVMLAGRLGETGPTARVPAQPASRKVHRTAADPSRIAGIRQRSQTARTVRCCKSGT
ncbi:MAG: hypothetical protein ACK414_07550 [Gemmobacter sp.]